jgi:hypothetical protein
MHCEGDNEDREALSQENSIISLSFIILLTKKIKRLFIIFLYIIKKKKTKSSRGLVVAFNCISLLILYIQRA